jgi:xanthine/uracil permease
LVAAGIGTLTFLCITKFRAPIVISNSGATVSAVVGAIALSGSVAENYTGVVIGGAIIAAVYTIAALFIKKYGTGWLQRLLPPVITGTVIMVIGANLATFIPTYAQIGGEYSIVGALVTIIVGMMPRQRPQNGEVDGAYLQKKNSKNL